VPDNDVNTIIARLVPIAIFGSKPKIRLREGTKRVPPPTPRIDARIPIKNAIVNPRRYSGRMLCPSF
jgi:hypothetical protein